MRGFTCTTAVVALALATLTATTSGCYRTTARRSSTPAQYPAQYQADYDSWHHHLLLGLIRVSPDIDLDEICGNRAIAQVHTKMNGWNWLLSVITGGIYTPTKLKVWCASETYVQGTPGAQQASTGAPAASAGGAAPQRGTAATATAPTRRRTRGAVAVNRDPLHGRVVRMQMSFPGMGLSLAAAPEKRPGQLVLAMATDGPGDTGAASCSQLRIAAGEARMALPVAERKGAQLLFTLDDASFQRMAAGRPLRLRLCSRDWTFDRVQVSTLERFAEELERTRAKVGAEVH